VPDTAKSLFKPYHGDKFGGRGDDNTRGIIYLSRMEAQHPVAELLRMHEAERQRTLSDGRPRGMSRHRSSGIENAEVARLEEENRRLAFSFATLSAKPGKASRIVQQGGLHALFRLARQSSDSSTQLSCTRALFNLSKETALRRLLVESGIVSVLIFLTSSHDGEPESIRAYCIRTIVNLCAAPHIESEIIQQGILPVLATAVNSKNYHVQRNGLTGLVNLTAVKTKYTRIQEVNEIFYHLSNEAITSKLVLTVDPRLAHQLLQGLANLTWIRGNQDTLTALGCPRVLSRFASSDLPTASKRLCLKSLSNLAECPLSRVKMVDTGQSIVPVLLKLAADGDQEMKQACAVVLSRLALDPSCALRMAQDRKSVPTIVNLCLCGLDDVHVHRLSAAALCSLAASSRTIATTLIEERAVGAFVALMNVEDRTTQLLCVQGICMLLAYGDDLDTIVHQGAIEPMMQIGSPSDYELSGLCALACYVLSRHPTLLQQGLRSTIIRALVRLSSVPEQNIPSTDDLVGEHFERLQSDCALALWNLSCVAGSNAQLLTQSIVQMIKLSLKRPSPNPQTLGDCLAALCNLAMDATNCAEMLQQGLLPHLLWICKLTPLANKAMPEQPHSSKASDPMWHMKRCAALMATLSFHGGSWSDAHGLDPFVQTLLCLSQLEHSPTKANVLLALYNISCGVDTRSSLLKDEVVRALIALSSRPDELVRRGCAATLCNISTIDSAGDMILKCHISGATAVKSLLITALVASDSIDTKRICAKAMFNLLGTNSGRQSMVDDGVLWGLSTIVKEVQGDVELARICASAFCNLCMDFFPQIIVSSSLKQLVSLIGRGDDETRLYSLRAIVNLLHASLKASGETKGALEPKIKASASYFHGLVLDALSACFDEFDAACEEFELCLFAMCIVAHFPFQLELLIRGKSTAAAVGAPDHDVQLTEECVVQEGLVSMLLRRVCRNELAATRNPELAASLVSRIMFLLSHSTEDATVSSLASEDFLQSLSCVIHSAGDNRARLHESMSCLLALCCNHDLVAAVVDLGGLELVSTVFRVYRDTLDVPIVAALSLILHNMACCQQRTSQLTAGGILSLIRDIFRAALTLSQPTLAEALTHLNVALCALLSNDGNSRKFIEDGAAAVILISVAHTMPQTNTFKQLPLLQGLDSASLTGLSQALHRRDGQLHIALALRGLLSSVTNHKPLASHGLIPILMELSHSSNKAVKDVCVEALRTLTFHQELRDLLVDSGAISVLLKDPNDRNKKSTDDPLVATDLRMELEAESWCNGSRLGSQGQSAIGIKPSLAIESGFRSTGERESLNIPVFSAPMRKFGCEMEQAMQPVNDSDARRSTSDHFLEGRVRKYVTKSAPTDKMQDATSVPYGLEFEKSDAEDIGANAWETERRLSTSSSVCQSIVENGPEIDDETLESVSMTSSQSHGDLEHSKGLQHSSRAPSVRSGHGASVALDQHSPNTAAEPHKSSPGRISRSRSVKSRSMSMNSLLTTVNSFRMDSEEDINLAVDKYKETRGSLAF